MDEQCIPGCKKSATLTNFRDETFYLNKELNSYNCLYYNRNFLNTNIVADIPDTFRSFFIDLRDIRTGTAAVDDKSTLLSTFTALLHGTSGAKEKINKLIYPATNSQYKKGI